MTLIFSPKWFYNIDSLFEFVSIAAGFLISFFSYKAYKLMKDQKYLVFASSFFLISVSFILKIVANTMIYYKELRHLRIGPFLVSGFVVRKIGWLETYGHFFHNLLLLSAIMLLVILVLKIKRRREIWLLFYFVILTAIFAISSAFMFNLTLAVLLAIVTYHFYRNCKEHPGMNAHLVFLAFLLLLVSQVVFIFNLMNPTFYVVGEVAQLMGYMVLLLTYVLVRKK